MAQKQYKSVGIPKDQYDEINEILEDPFSRYSSISHFLQKAVELETREFKKYRRLCELMEEERGTAQLTDAQIKSLFKTFEKEIGKRKD